MATWANRRKFFYISVILIVIIVAVAIPAFVFFYDRPTCSDGILNQKEGGVDCGGPCPKLCSDRFLVPRVSWARLNPVAPGIYNAGAYIVNPNTDGIAYNVPYKFTLYDAKGIFIAERKGSITIPPHKNVLAFEPGVETSERLPVRVSFEFEAPPEWRIAPEVTDQIDVRDINLTEDETGMSLTATLTNPTFLNYKGITVFAVLYDDRGNQVAFLRTRIDKLHEHQSASATFTWPPMDHGVVTSKEIIAIVDTIIDPRK